MSGPAYIGWAHWRFLGDEAAAKALIPQARKVLGFADQQARRGQLVTNTYTQQLPGGGHITAEIHGQQPRVSIYVPPGGDQRIPVRLPEDFVVWARDESRPEGIDAAYPQQILRPKWKTFFFNSEVDGYEGFQGPKGVYQFGQDGGLLFPDGIRHSGNIDWRSVAGQHLSWYGPSTRYWVDPFVQVRTQYGKQVFMLGQVLLDVDQYIEDSDPDLPFSARYVMGAALDGLDLYVVHADLPVGTTSTAPVPGGTYMTDPYYPTAPIPHEVCRYRLIPDPDHPTFRKVLSRSREVLWEGGLRTGAMPWFFNPQATRAHCFSVPAGSFGGIDFVSFSTLGGTPVPPSPTAPVVMLEIDGDNVTVTTVQVSVSPSGEGALAGDYDDAGNPVQVLVSRQQRAVGGLEPGANMISDHWMMSVGGATVDLQRQYRDQGSTGDYTVRRSPMYVDARTGFAVFFREVAHASFTFDLREVWVEVYLRGELVHEELKVSQTGSAIEFTGLVRDYSTLDQVNSAWREYNVSPMYALYGFMAWVVGLESGGGYPCRHPGFIVLPYQAGHYYGARKAGGTTGPPNPTAAECSVTPERERLDFDGKDLVISGASGPAASMFSGYTFTNGQLDSCYWISDRSLEELTGVDGANARYHPLWTLGVPLPTN